MTAYFLSLGLQLILGAGKNGLQQEAGKGVLYKVLVCTDLKYLKDIASYEP